MPKKRETSFQGYKEWNHALLTKVLEHPCQGRHTLGQVNQRHIPSFIISVGMTAKIFKQLAMQDASSVNSVINLISSWSKENQLCTAQAYEFFRTKIRVQPTIELI